MSKHNVTLYVNRSDSHCDCWANILDIATVTTCPKCGGTFTHISSDYGDMAKRVAPMRPDLEPYFPWDKWWQSDAGQQAAKELGAL